MQEINTEYDVYFTSLTIGIQRTPNIDDWFYKRAARSREEIIFVIFNKRANRYECINTTNHNKQLINAYVSSNISEPGFYKLKVQSIANIQSERIVPQQISIDDYNAILLFNKDFNMVEAFDTLYVNSEKLEFTTPFGVIYKDYYLNSCKLLHNGIMHTIRFYQFPKSFKQTNSITYFDVLFNRYQECTYDEFCSTHDVSYSYRYHVALQMTKMNEDVYISNGTIQHLHRIGVVTMYQSKYNFRLQYGTFNLAKLIHYLPYLTIEDIEEIQDFFDELHNELDESVKKMIKKGKLHIKF